MAHKAGKASAAPPLERPSLATDSSRADISVEPNCNSEKDRGGMRDTEKCATEPLRHRDPKVFSVSLCLCGESALCLAGCTDLHHGLLDLSHDDTRAVGCKRWSGRYFFASKSVTHWGIATGLGLGICPQGCGTSTESMRRSDSMSLNS